MNIAVCCCEFLFFPFPFFWCLPILYWLYPVFFFVLFFTFYSFLFISSYIFFCFLIVDTVINHHFLLLCHRLLQNRFADSFFFFLCVSFERYIAIIHTQTVMERRRITSYNFLTLIILHLNFYAFKCSNVYWNSFFSINF